MAVYYEPKARGGASMKRFIAWLLILLTAVSLLAAAQGEDITYTGKIVGGKLHLRAAPQSDGKILKTYSPGTEVTVLENDGVWCRVQIGSNEGYMMAQYLEISANYPHAGWGVSKRDGTVLTLLSQPDQDSVPAARYMSGTAMELVENTGNYWKVRIGTGFGYVPKDQVIPRDGEYETALSFSASTDGLRLKDLEKSRKEFGNSKTKAKESGDLPYSLTYPLLNIPEADERIRQFLDDTLSVFRQDHERYHAGEDGRYTVDYMARKADERYGSVVLMGEYTAGSVCLQVFLTVNVDLERQALLSLSDCFPEPLRLSYSIQGLLASLMSRPTDGYDGSGDLSLLDSAALTREGLEIYLPAGLYLPISLGSRKITVPYTQIAETMEIDSEFIKSHKRVIDPAKPMIALTFDDGPSEETDRILNILAQYDARATFCVQGMNVSTYGSTVKKAIALGNEIASHTWNHPKLTEKSVSTIRSQLERTNAAVQELTGGYEIRVLRPPYGSYNKNVKTICKDLNMVIATWHVDTEDWKTRSASKTYNAIMKGAKTTGVIILCHDLYSSTADAVIRAVPELTAKGVQLVTVSELLSFHKDGIKPGTVYSRVDPKNMKTE